MDGFAPRWLERHLTKVERARCAGASADPYRYFWTLFAAKEAGYKAFAQAGIATPYGGYTWLEVDLDAGTVAHLASGVTARIRVAEMDREHIHCVALFDAAAARELSSGDERASLSDVMCGVERLPAGADPSDFVRACLVRRLTRGRFGDADLCVVEVGGIPRVMRSGVIGEHSVSLSHAGRFVAWSALNVD